MDISICSILCLIAIFLPLIYAIYLFCARLSLSFVGKKMLNYGCSASNLFAFVLFLLIKFLFINKTQIADIHFNFFNIEKFSLNFGFSINEANILFLIFSSFLCFVVSMYSKLYFDKKKQFIFTKQRYYAFLATLSFLTYAFIASSNLFQGVIMLILQSTLISAFAYFDIFKHPKNFNITRFHRISLLGNFSLLIAIMILFRYAILSKGYIISNSINYTELNALISYTYGISSLIEFKIMSLCLLITVMSRLMIFPLSCYYSFFANSSNIMFLTVAILANNIIGVFLYLKIIPLIQMFKNCILFFEIFIGIGILFALIQILFERNLKIIFGYLLSVINSAFLILFLIYDINLIQNSYFIVNSLFAIVLMILFFKDKTNIKRRLINKQTGFILEKSHIFLLETMPEKIATIINWIDEKIIQNLASFWASIFNYTASLFAIKTIKSSKVKIIKNILITIAFFVLFAIFTTLFGGVK